MRQGEMPGNKPATPVRLSPAFSDFLGIILGVSWHRHVVVKLKLRSKSPKKVVIIWDFLIYATPPRDASRECISPPGGHGPWANSTWLFPWLPWHPQGTRNREVTRGPHRGWRTVANEDGPWPMAPPQGGDYGREEARRPPPWPP